MNVRESELIEVGSNAPLLSCMHAESTPTTPAFGRVNGEKSTAVIPEFGLEPLHVRVDAEERHARLVRDFLWAIGDEIKLKSAPARMWAVGRRDP